MRPPLIDLCPRLDRSLRPLPIVDAPTPVEPLERLGASLDHHCLFAKRDDRTNAEYGGNKPRKLAYLLADAVERRRRTVITAGALGSHHVVATSLFGRKVGLAVAAWLTPQPATPEMRANLLSHALLETEVHLLRGPADLPGALARAFAAKTFFAERPALILPGGSSPVGVLGFVDAGLEFARQVAEGTCPKPAAVVLPCGTGGTAAGLALGMALAGLDSPVVAVRVVPAAWTPAALPGVLARATAALLARHGLFAALPAAARIRLRVDDRYLGDGYGRATAAGAEARDVLRRLEGIRLEPTYTAKAAAAFLDLARSPEMRDRSLVLWLTASAAPAPGASAPESAYLALPPEFHRWFRGES